LLKQTVYILLLLLITLDCSAQRHKKKKLPPAPIKDSAQVIDKQRANVCEYYVANRLSVDSCNSPFLYYKIFDWVGTHYRYAGNSTKGIDCSGFVKKIYKEVYCVDLTGGSREICTATNPVNKDSLKEGDMVFFKIRRGEVSHMGIYLGKNKFAHAAVKGGVRVNDLDEPYYKKYFYKGGRL
jgi:murein DD-endopeptidase / murein LD-carboxypeptidase